MKKMILILLSFCMFLYSCNKNNHCVDIYEAKPKDLKPIDFENYNDVSTVYWSYLGYCSEINRSWQDREFVLNLNNYLDYPNQVDSVKVWGWVYEYFLPSTGQFFINSIKNGGSRNKNLSVFLPVHIGNELSLKLIDVTFPAKCYLYGKVLLPCLEEGTCPNKVTVSLYVNDVTNIYFE